MLSFKPFKGIHAKEENTSDFPMYSPENYSEEQIKSKLRGKTPSYVDIIKPTFFKGESPLENRFKKVRKRFEDYLNENFVENDPASIYIYEQKKRNGEIFKGIIGLISVDDFKENNVKVPEQTNEQKQKVFTQFLDITYLQSNPVLLSYDSNSKLEVMMDLEMKSKPLIQIIDELEISHKLWRVDNRLKLAQFKDAVEKLPALYLADGHYRMAAAVEHSDKIKEKSKSKDFLFDQNHHVMSLIASSQSIRIHEYNRLIKSLNGLTRDELFAKLEEHFTINEKGVQPYFPSHKHHISMYFEGKFYGLYIKHEFRGTPEGLGNIDTYLFNKFVLGPIFDISTNKEEKQKVSYIKGSGDIKGITDIKVAVDNGDYKIGFAFYPVSFSDLQLISDLGLKIPAKSTFIEPKLLLGLLMFDMK
ncbi:DUF1015 domain-containing protein [Apibacter sp. HY039]|uniref:DUF1015 domain-containing protein n=1 Tax=Apibacter sp. HY039 TaxID=2501476 RepID=UPI000FEBF28E|nr:DUF1015 domain-containing protein [Apibacter sp. HY039]